MLQQPRTSALHTLSTVLCVVRVGSHSSPSVVDCCEQSFKLYDLKQLGQSFGLSFEEGNHEASARCCKLLLESILNATSRNMEIAVEANIPHLEESSLCDVLCTKNQKPDLFLCLKEDVTAEMIVEIHSSPYEDTIRKALFVATDLLRLRRMYNDGIKTLTAFTFPKLPKIKGETIPQCVVKLVVTWENFSVYYELTQLKTHDDVRREILEAVSSFAVLNTTQMSMDRVLMKLSTDDLEKFNGINPKQIPSQGAIMVSCGDSIFKRPLWNLHACVLTRVVSQLTVVALSRPSQNAITIQKQPAIISETYFFKYDRVHYDPMTEEEAKKCLQHFFSEVRSVIGQLHDTYKLAHMDIRLDNICFNQQFKPILIDLDRSEMLGTDLGEESVYASCMSRRAMSPGKTDWMQLGWMIAWILEPGEDYHDRDFEGLSDNMKENAMLKTLIQEGLVSEGAVDDEIFGEYQDPISTVLQKRGD